MGPEIVVVAAIAYVGFMQWLHHQRRQMVHRERLAAIEKGASLPPDAEPQRGWLAALALSREAAPSPEELRRRRENVQRLLLLAGLVWLSLGISAFVVLSAVLSASSPAAHDIPRGLEWIGLAPATIGLSHLVVYAVGRYRER
jgi:hypothetical protein